MSSGISTVVTCEGPSRDCWPDASFARNPRSYLEQETSQWLFITPGWPCISMGFSGSLTGARSQFLRRGIRNIFVLVIIYMLTGCYEFEYLDRVTADCFKLALVNFTTELERVPRKVINDPGSALCSLDRKPLLSALLKMKVETVGTHHQLLHFSHQTWEEIHGLMIGMIRNTSRSI